MELWLEEGPRGEWFFLYQQTDSPVLSQFFVSAVMTELPGYLIYILLSDSQNHVYWPAHITGVSTGIAKVSVY